jgi:hypothetical protein
VIAEKHDESPMQRLGRYPEWCMMLWIAWGEYGHLTVSLLGCGIGEALRDGMGRGMYERSRNPCVLRSSFAAA